MPLNFTFISDNNVGSEIKYIGVNVRFVLYENVLGVLFCQILLTKPLTFVFCNNFVTTVTTLKNIRL